ncbi:hypothetical protein LCGC14_1767630 [marine sediment metagenome]|uniref:Cytochrome c-552/4 domain-containing protein n=1 Tax=marine sediment metagenome TaxID=412755 RepID=A0A0F9HLP6_9ZZZZ
MKHCCKDFNPDLVVAPSICDSNQDHATVGLNAGRVFKDRNLISYKEPWNCDNKRIDYFVPISDEELDKKIVVKESGHTKSDEYKKQKEEFDKKVKEEKKDPECLRCHATAYKMKIKKGKSKKGSKNFIEDVACEACHGPGEAYVKVKKNYQKKGKDAFKKLLKEDPMMARKVQYDTGLYVAGINKYKTIKEQCLECHWEDVNDKNKCPKCDKDEKGKPIVMKFKKYFKLDDHRDHDTIDDVLPKVDKKKWKGYLEQDPLFKTKPSNAK